MTYFNSEIIQECAADMEVVKQYFAHCAERVDRIDSMENKSDYYYALYALADKLHNMYIRVSLETFDPEGEMIKQDIYESAKNMGMLVGGNPDEYLRELKEECKTALRELGQDLDEAVDLS